MSEITLQINNQTVKVPQGTTVATAVFLSRAETFRRSISGKTRLPVCGMGICFECRVEIDGIKHQRSCQIPAENGMEIRTDEQT